MKCEPIEHLSQRHFRVLLNQMSKNKAKIHKNQINSKETWLNNHYTGPVLILLYCALYGTIAQTAFKGHEQPFFFSSIFFALTVYHIRKEKIQNIKMQKSILGNPIISFSLVIIYLLVFGICALFQLSGFQLVIFMSSYILTILIFTSPLFYISDPKELHAGGDGTSSSLTTGSFFVEKYPCFINGQDLSWLIRDLNESMSGVIGFAELLFQKKYTNNEREYMLRNIYQKSLEMSHAINKVAAMYPSSTNPKDIHEIVDLLADNNFV